jgi:peptidyl-prolyl cis-trans isomerase D
VLSRAPAMFKPGKTTVGVIVGAIILVFVLEFRAGSGNPTNPLTAECAVEYDGDCLDSKDYYASYGMVVPRGIQPKDSRALKLRKKVLDGLAERELLIAEATRLGFAMSDDVVERELTAGRAQLSLPAEDLDSLAYRLGLCRLAENGYGCEPGTPLGVRQLRVSRTAGEPFDYKLYEREIRLIANRGPKEFRATQERELLAERMRELVRQRVRVPESEAFVMFERGRSRATVRSATLDRSWFAKYGIELNDAAVDKWMATNALQIDEAWKVDKDKFQENCPLVSEITLALPPNALDAEKAPLKEKITALRERVAKGESFEGVAREASNAPSASFGGKVGCLNASYGLGAEDLRAAAEKLQPGALSDVIETPRGLHVLRLDGKLAAANVESVGRRQLAKSLYAKLAADESMRAFAAELVKQVKGGAKLEDAIRVHADEVARKYQPAKNTAAGEKSAEASAAMLAADRPRFEVSAPFSISGNPMPDVDPTESLAARAFELSAPDQIDEKPVETATGLVVIQLKEKTPASREEFEKEKWPLLRALRQAKASEALTRYVADLRRAAGDKLKVNAKFAEESKADANE